MGGGGEVEARWVPAERSAPVANEPGLSAGEALSPSHRLTSLASRSRLPSDKPKSRGRVRTEAAVKPPTCTASVVFGQLCWLRVEPELSPFPESSRARPSSAGESCR